MISLKNICFNSRQNKIIDNLSIDFEINQLIGILSDDVEMLQHLFRILGGIIPPDEGNVIINNVDIFNGTPEDIRNLRKHLSFVFQSGGLISNLTILENLMLPLDYFYSDQSRVEKYEKIFFSFIEFDLDEKILNERPAALSSSIKKLLLFIRAYLIEPNSIMYDRPFDYLNMRHKDFIFKKITNIQALKSTSQIFYNTMDKSLYDTANICYVITKDSVITKGKWTELIMDNSVSVRNVIKNILGE